MRLQRLAYAADLWRLFGIAYRDSGRLRLWEFEVFIAAANDARRAEQQQQRQQQR